MLGKGLESLIPPSEPFDPGGTEPVGQESALAAPFPSDKEQATRDKGVPPLQVDQGKESPVSAEATADKPAPAPPPRENFAEKGQAIFQIEVEKIAPNPHQPRKEFNDESLRELAQSIREFGILQPLVVTKVERETPTGVAVSYELIAGERRLMAAKLLGLERVPAIVRTVDTERNRLEMAVIENIQRENLNPVEMARAFARLQDEFRLTQREIASRLGKSREVVANTLRLLDAPTYIQDAVSRGEISESHARLLLSVTDPDAQEKLFRDLGDRHLTTRELRLRIGAKKPASSSDMEQGTRDKGILAISPELLALEEKLTSELGTPVKIVQTEAGGKITILFYSPEELQSILHKLGTKEEA